MTVVAVEPSEMFRRRLAFLWSKRMGTWVTLPGSYVMERVTPEGWKDVELSG